jgi:hypothetical protein
MLRKKIMRMRAHRPYYRTFQKFFSHEEFREKKTANQIAVFSSGKSSGAKLTTLNGIPLFFLAVTWHFCDVAL